ncbi:MAG: UPF0149 family protein [Xanthomonadales bacterium]|nr:UPF0149 family protein [Xanthomonadales bacterium]
MPDFHHALLLSRGNLDAAELAECHGVLCGLICRNGAVTPKDYLAQLATLQLVAEPEKALAEIFSDAHESTIQQLADIDMGFNLWLPDDDQPLNDRTDALAQWCTGFLAGIGLGGELPTLSEEATEALDDMRHIAQAAYPQLAITDAERDEMLKFEAEDEETQDEGEEVDETAFMEIVEYVRVVTLMLCEEMRGPGDEDRIH